MSKTSNPVMKDGLGIVARLVIIAALLSILGNFLQGCAGKTELTDSPAAHQSLNISPQEAQQLEVEMLRPVNPASFSAS